jgi:hypothetical protein
MKSRDRLTLALSLGVVGIALNLLVLSKASQDSSRFVILLLLSVGFASVVLLLENMKFALGVLAKIGIRLLGVARRLLKWPPAEAGASLQAFAGIVDSSSTLLLGLLVFVIVMSLLVEVAVPGALLRLLCFLGLAD